MPIRMTPQANRKASISLVDVLTRSLPPRRVMNQRHSSDSRTIPYQTSVKHSRM